MTRSCSASSIWSSRSDSSSAMRVTGMPVHIATTWAMSSSVTSACRRACVCLPVGCAAASMRRLGAAPRASRRLGRELVLLVVDRRFLLACVTRSSSFCASFSSAAARSCAHAHAAGGLVDQVDRLVRQEAVGDVADRQVGGGLERLVGDLELVVLLVALADAVQDLDRLLERRLLDHDRLEAALQGGVPLDVLAVLVERGRADALQLAARERRLEDVGGVDRAFGRARADERVQLVDEQDARRWCCASPR